MSRVITSIYWLLYDRLAKISQNKISVVRNIDNFI